MKDLKIFYIPNFQNMEDNLNFKYIVGQSTFNITVLLTAVDSAVSSTVMSKVLC